MLGFGLARAGVPAFATILKCSTERSSHFHIRPAGTNNLVAASKRPEGNGGGREKPKPLQARTSVKDAGEKIRSLQTDRLAVASGDRLIGTVKGKYPERRAAGFGHDPETTLVREIMVKEAYYCFENQSLDEAREIMRKHHLQYLPVVDDRLRVVGVVGQRELAAIAQQQNETSQTELHK